MNSLIEKAIVGAINVSDIENELKEICNRVHGCCGTDCPVYSLNGGVPDSVKDFQINRGCDCYKDGKKMLEFIASKTCAFKILKPLNPDFIKSWMAAQIFESELEIENLYSKVRGKFVLLNRSVKQISEELSIDYWIVQKMCNGLIDYVYHVYGYGAVALSEDLDDVVEYQFKARGKRQLLELIEQCLDDGIVILKIEQLEDVGQIIDNGNIIEVSENEKHEAIRNIILD